MGTENQEMSMLEVPQEIVSWSSHSAAFRQSPFNQHQLKQCVKYGARHFATKAKSPFRFIASA